MPNWPAPRHNPVDVARLLGAIIDLANETRKDPNQAEIVLQVQSGGRSDLDPMLAASWFSAMIRGWARSSAISSTMPAPSPRRHQDPRPGAAAPARDVEFRVEDQGPGIRPDNLERIFERFYTDRPEGSFGKNSGLGLSISKQIVEAHKGRIWAENRYGRARRTWRKPVLGARFIVRIPAVADDWTPPGKK